MKEGLFDVYVGTKKIGTKMELEFVMCLIRGYAQTHPLDTDPSAGIRIAKWMSEDKPSSNPKFA